jgi:uncharacterized pyridoxamine 5'-phosphate oxidase family protein
MAEILTREQVWAELEKHLFAVIGMVNAKNEARTAGVVYAVHEGKLYLTTGKESWKARHIAQNPHVSVTVPIDKRIPFLPWIKIPAATITFCGLAKMLEANEVGPDVLRSLFRGLEDDQELMAAACIIEVKPVKDFITYGVGVSLMTMRNPEKARGRVHVGNGQMQ